jgi:hypothetical protein
VESFVFIGDTRSILRAKDWLPHLGPPSATLSGRATIDQQGAGGTPMGRGLPHVRRAAAIFIVDTGFSVDS